MLNLLASLVLTVAVASGLAGLYPGSAISRCLENPLCQAPVECSLVDQPTCVITP